MTDDFKPHPWLSEVLSHPDALTLRSDSHATLRAVALALSASCAADGTSLARLVADAANVPEHDRQLPRAVQQAEHRDSGAGPMTDVPQGCADDCCAYAEPPHNRAERPLGATKPPNPSPGSDNGSRGSQDENCDHLSHGWSLAEVVAPGYSLGDVPVCNGCGQVWWP